MAAITVSPTTGLRIDTGVAATTVRLYDLPTWTHSVLVAAPATTGAILEVAWSGTDGGASSTANEWVYVPAGGSVVLDVPRPLFVGSGTVPKLYVRPQSADATTINVIVSAKSAS